MTTGEIRSLDLTQTSPNWQLVAELDEPELEGHYLNSASYMALNGDGSLVAVAYRSHPLSAWETNGSEPIGHCWRKREEVARGEVISAVWHPHLPVVLGLYLEGVVFKWRPYDGESEEIATGASRIAISRDGNLFAAGDVHGTVRVYTTSDACLLYQLASQDTVLGLAFSPDLRRFYDIRGYYGNAWEPSALMRYAGQLGKGIENESETDSIGQGSVTSVSVAKRIDSITALTGSPIGRLHCCGTEKGTVSLYDSQQRKLADLHASRSFLSVEQISLKTFSVARTVDWHTPECKWISHPRDPALIVGIAPDAIHVLDWDLTNLHSCQYEYPLSENTPPSPDNPTAQDKVARVLVTHDKNHLLVQISLLSRNSKEKAFLYFQTSSFATSQARPSKDPKAMAPTILPRDLSSLIALPLSFLSQNRPVFLSRSFSICSWQFPSNSSLTRSVSAPGPASPKLSTRRQNNDAAIAAGLGIKQLFSLPGDWISRDCLALCSIWGKEKSLLCPRNGEVAVVRCAGLV